MKAVIRYKAGKMPALRLRKPYFEYESEEAEDEEAADDVEDDDEDEDESDDDEDDDSVADSDAAVVPVAEAPVVDVPAVEESPLLLEDEEFSIVNTEEYIIFEVSEESTMANM